MSDPCERCRGWEFWGMDDRRNYFFKVMLGDFQHRMTIPHKFARRFRENIQGKIKLKACNGNTGTAVITKYPNKLVLEAGWGAFVSTNDIKLGDFLVFRYNDLQFEVLIFDPSCCVKEPSNFAGTVCNHVPRKYIDLTEISSDSDDHEPMKSPRSEATTPTQKKGHNQRKKKMNTSTSHLRAFDVSSSKDVQEIHSMINYIFSPWTHLTDMQKMKVEKNVRAICSDIPLFVAVMNKTSITRKPCYMGFCKKYADQYLPREDRIGKLQRNGKHWQVQFRITKKNSRRFSVGWKEFASDNKLKIGDICLFELLKNEKRLAMDIRIIRKQ